METETKHAHLPDDLLTLRQAEARLFADCGITVGILRSWISHGLGGRRLNTYRVPGLSEVMMVSKSEAAGFATLATRSAVRARSIEGRGKGRCNLYLKEDEAAEVRAYAAAVAKRLGFPSMSIVDAVRLAVSVAMKQEPK